MDIFIIQIVAVFSRNPRSGPPVATRACTRACARVWVRFRPRVDCRGGRVGLRPEDVRVREEGPREEEPKASPVSRKSSPENIGFELVASAPLFLFSFFF